MDALQALVDTVQYNCDVADARHARDMTLCTYLLEMRELYRWEQELPLTAMPPREALGRWLTERETRWNDLEESEYRSIRMNKTRLMMKSNGMGCSSRRTIYRVMCVYSEQVCRRISACTPTH